MLNNVKFGKGGELVAKQYQVKAGLVISKPSVEGSQLVLVDTRAGQSGSTSQNRARRADQGRVNDAGV